MIKRGSGGGLIGLCAVLAVGCGDDTRTTTLQWYRIPCHGPFPQLCPADRDATGELHLVYDAVTGYELTWGVEADVRYHLEPGPDGEDAGDDWVVDTVLAERTMTPGAALTWSVGVGETWFTAAGDHVEVLGEPVACAPALCAELTTVDATARRLVDVEFTGDATAPLRAVAVRPAP